MSTYTVGSQGWSRVAMSADGSAVVVWVSGGQDGSDSGVYAQRYAASGAPVGTEFRVNTFTTGNQWRPDVAMDADGDFVVVWDSKAQDSGTNYGVFGQRYDASGVPVGEEFRVNTYVTSRQYAPSVAMDTDGDFVVVWTSQQKAGAYDDIYAQRYESNGTPRGEEFHVSASVSGWQSEPSVAMDADGDFVVVWTSISTQNEFGFDIYAQRYGASGQELGPAYRVNTVTTSDQTNPDAAMSAEGRFVVAWIDRNGEAASSWDVHAQRYGTTGAAEGGEFRVNSYTFNVQGPGSVAMDGDGDFVVTWNSMRQLSDSTDVLAQRYTSAGVKRGTEVLVNTYTTGAQVGGSVASDVDGNFLVVWEGDAQDGDSYGVYGQRYSRWTVATEDGPGVGLSLSLTPSPISAGYGQVSYSLPAAAFVRMSLYDPLGREVAELHEGMAAAGEHEVILDASRLAPGTYVVRLAAGDHVLTRRVVVAR